MSNLLLDHIQSNNTQIITESKPAYRRNNNGVSLFDIILLGITEKALIKEFTGIKIALSPKLGHQDIFDNSRQQEYLKKFNSGFAYVFLSDFNYEVKRAVSKNKSPVDLSKVTYKELKKIEIESKVLHRDDEYTVRYDMTFKNAFLGFEKNIDLDVNPYTYHNFKLRESK